MTDLETRLTDLGDNLDFDDADLVAGILDRLQPSRRRWSSVWLRAAAVALVVVAATAIAVPDARRTVADWFGFGAVSIQRLPDDAVQQADATFELAGPGDSSIEVVDGREILVSRFDARLPAPLLSKAIGTSTQVIAVEVDGHPGVWVGEGPHDVFYETDDGFGVTRTAGRTLLWQDGDVLFRLEGFLDLEAALEFAATLD